MLPASSEFDRQEELSRTSSRSTTPFASGVEVLCKIRCTFCLVRLCRRCCGRGLAKRVTVCCCWWYCGERRRSLSFPQGAKGVTVESEGSVSNVLAKDD